MYKKIYLVLLSLLLIPLSFSSLYNPDEYTSLYLPFDNCAGVTVSDSSLFNNNGVVGNNTKWVGYSNCINGCCLSFDGVNDYVSIPDDSSLDFTENMSIAMWYKAETGTQYFLEKGFGTETNEPNYEIIVNRPSNYQFAFRDGTTLRSAGTSSVYDDNNFHCLVIAKNSTNVIFYYDDSVEVEASAYTMNTNNNPLILGYGHSPLTYSNFTIDELIIENTTVNSSWVDNYCGALPDSCLLCNEWYYNNTCENEYAQFVRNCPDSSTCSNTSYYIKTDYCSKEYNKSQGIFTQEYKIYNSKSVCDTGLIKSIDNPITRCDTHLDVPVDCSNTNITHSLKVYVDYIDIIGKDNSKNFETKLCSPLNDCLQDSLETCNNGKNGNITVSRYTTADGGDSIDTAFIIDNVNCSVNKAWYISIGASEGWYQHGIIGTSNYVCSKSCGGTKCLTEGLIEYSVEEFIDCSINETSKTLCDYGCNQATGECLESTESDDGSSWIDDGSDLNYWLNMLIKPSETMKFIISLFVSSVLGIIGISLTKDRNVFLFLVGFAIGFMFFVLIGWIPVIIILIMVFMVLVYGGLKALK